MNLMQLVIPTLFVSLCMCIRAMWHLLVFVLQNQNPLVLILVVFKAPIADEKDRHN